MTLRRFFVEHPLEPGQRIQLEGTAARHIATVLRMREGAPLILFNGLGGEFHATLTERRKRSPVVEIGAPIEPLPPSAPPLHLAMALTKGAAMDLTIQKATELGAARITPLRTERTEVKLGGDRSVRRVSHWREVSASSCEQCGRHYLPEIDAPESLTTWMAGCEGELKVMLHPDGNETPAQLPGANGTVVIAIGPEGGFSERECEGAQAAGFRLVRIGPRTLRADTAPVVALTLFQYLWGDLASPSREPGAT